MYDHIRGLLFSRQPVLVAQAIELMLMLPLKDKQFDAWIGRWGEGSYELEQRLGKQHLHLKPFISALVCCTRRQQSLTLKETWDWTYSPNLLPLEKIERLSLENMRSEKLFEALERVGPPLKELSLHSDNRLLFSAGYLHQLAARLKPLTQVERVSFHHLESEALCALTEHRELFEQTLAAHQDKPFKVRLLSEALTEALQREPRLEQLIDLEHALPEEPLALKSTSNLLKLFAQKSAHRAPQESWRRFAERRLRYKRLSARERERLLKVAERTPWGSLALYSLRTDEGSRGAYGLPMTLCPAGEFFMGVSGRGQKEAQPRHLIKIKAPFWIAQQHLTSAQLHRAIEVAKTRSHINPEIYQDLDASSFQGALTGVPWYKGAMICNLLSQLDGLTPVYDLPSYNIIVSKHGKYQDYHASIDLSASGYRFPTEAEWEYAAKAGTELRYAGSDEVSEVAWYGYRSKDPKRTVKSRHDVYVARKRPNDWQLFDMSGGVAEWCLDRWDEEAYQGRSSEAPTPDPLMLSRGDDRVVRGGHWEGGAKLCEVNHRSHLDPSAGRQFIGLRLVRRAVELDE